MNLYIGYSFGTTILILQEHSVLIIVLCGTLIIKVFIVNIDSKVDYKFVWGRTETWVRVLWFFLLGQGRDFFQSKSRRINHEQ